MFHGGSVVVEMVTGHSECWKMPAQLFSTYPCSGLAIRANETIATLIWLCSPSVEVRVKDFLYVD